MKKIKKVTVCILALQNLTMFIGTAAHAKKKAPMKAYSFIVEGGKASQGECDGEKKIPKLKKLKELSKANAYMGSELQNPEIKGKVDGDMWKHFFRNKPACNMTLAKTPSAINEKGVRTQELPPEDSEDGDSDASDTSDSKD